MIEAESKIPGLKAIGIIVDADDQFDSRWSSVRERCRKIAADFPEELPPEGLIHQNEHGLRIGVWIMPDNQSRGMLETFLGSLVTPRLVFSLGFRPEMLWPIPQARLAVHGPAPR